MKKEYAEATNSEPAIDVSVQDELGGGDTVNQALTVRQEMALGEVTGEVGMSDVRVPRLETTYGVGKFVGVFHPGAFVLGGDHLLVELDQALTVIIMAAVQYWKEYLSNDAWKDGRRPQTFATEKQVLAAGGTTEWDNDQGRSVPPTYSKSMDMKLLIKKPENLESGIFGLEIKDDLYTPALWTVDKSAYRRVGPTVLSAVSFSLRARGLLSGRFEVTNKIETINSNQVVVPNISLVGQNDDEFIKAIRAIFEAPKDAS